MIKKVNIKGLLYVGGLALLLLLSPCSVRNQLQSKLDVPQTQVHNVNKSIINSTNCNANTAEKAISTSSKIVFQSHNDFAKDSGLSLFHKIALNQQHNFSTSSEIGEDLSLIPYYILFQKLKLHV